MTELRAVAQLRCIGTSGSNWIAQRQPAVASPPRMAGRGNGALAAMKFGGTSVTSVDDLQRAARKIVAARESSKPVVAVLSARGATTDELLALANETCSRPEPRELDMLLSVGERISCALCAMAIQELGHRAVSLTGSQAGSITDSAHTKARILEVRADRIRDALAQGLIVLRDSRASPGTVAT